MYSKSVLNLFANPANAGRIMKPDGIASLSNENGTANVEFSLRIVNDIIDECNFRAQANPYIVAVCSTITKMVVGKHIDDAVLDSFSIKQQLGQDLDIDITFCIECLYLAFENYLEIREKEGKPKSNRGRKKKVVEQILDDETAQTISDALAVVEEGSSTSHINDDENIDEGFSVEPEPVQGNVEEEPQTASVNQTNTTNAFEGSIFNNPIFVNFFNHIPKE